MLPASRRRVSGLHAAQKHTRGFVDLHVACIPACRTRVQERHGRKLVSRMLVCVSRMLACCSYTCGSHACGHICLCAAALDLADLGAKGKESGTGSR